MSKSCRPIRTLNRGRGSFIVPRIASEIFITTEPFLMNPFIRRVAVCIRIFEAQPLSSIVFCIARGRGPYSLQSFGRMRGGAPPPLVDSRTGQPARACSSTSKPVVAPDMRTRPLGATPANSSREVTPPRLLWTRGLLFLSSFQRMLIDCSSSRRTDPAVGSVELALTLPIDSGELKSMSLALRHHRHFHQ